MKSMTKRTGAILAVAAYAATAVAGLGLTFDLKANAADDPKEGLTYYYSGLKYNPRAERFYKAFETLEESGAFKTGEVDYNIVENKVVVGQDVSDYVDNGSSKLPIAFGAGRDAFLMDNPDLFYWDVFSVSISAGVQGGNYVAFMDTSRTDDPFVGHLNTEAKINDAIIEYEAALKTVVDGAKAASGDKKAQIEYVNKYIGDHTEYDFCATITDGETGFAPEADYIDTAYGALVNGKAICGGYAKAFKAVMDRLGIPCVCVQGYSYKDGSSEFVAHMWNAVKLDGMWYAVDVTWNDTAGKNDWLLIGEKALTKDHVEDKVISSSGYELKYPALKPYNYGNDTDENGMDIKGEYEESTDGTGKFLSLTVAYDGKGAEKLEEDGKYFSFRMGDKGENGTIVWGPWFNLIAAEEEFAGGFSHTDTECKFILHAGIEFIQFALMDYGPDLGLAGSSHKIIYDETKLTDEHISQPSAPYQNEGFGSYIPSPGANVTPTNTGAYDVNGTYQMKFVYTDTLVLAEGKTEKDVKLHVETSRGNDTISDNIVITDFKWDGNKTITFTFKPSKMFIHNAAEYKFTPTNLVGKKSNKIPDPVSYFFKGKSVVCSKIFNDGRLYMSVYGEPNILDTSDLSMNDFKDDSGNYYAKDQRSQLLLVANKPGNAKSDQMVDMLGKEEGIAESDIVTTATYEIDLQICGVVQKVPNGSYMQVAFGFPEGFSPDDAGTTFKIYHYTHDKAGNITGVEEIPVIVTEYGLIAKVSSFSPFTVVQVKKSAVGESANKSVYASVLGNGGTIKTEAGTSGVEVLNGDSVTYNIVPESGYKIDRVMLNGKPLSADRYVNGKLTLTKEELAEGNTLEASFVTVASAEHYEKKGVEIKQPDTIIIDSNKIMESFEGATTTDSKTIGVVIGCVVGAVVLAAGTGAAIYLVRNKKRSAK